MAKYGSGHALALLIVLSLSGCLSEPNEIPDLQGTSAIPGAEVSLAITTPLSSAEMDTTDASVNLAGIAASELGIFMVSWSNDRGSKGTASGTDSWQTGRIGLELGDNRITVQAEDTAGRTNSRTIKVRRESGLKGSTTLSWSAPSSRVDGSPLTNLAGYKIEYGRMSGVYDYEIDVDNPGMSAYVVEELVPGEWYFAVAAYDSEGLVSDPSNEAVVTIN